MNAGCLSKSTTLQHMMILIVPGILERNLRIPIACQDPFLKNTSRIVLSGSHIFYDSTPKTTVKMAEVFYASLLPPLHQADVWC